MRQPPSHATEEKSQWVGREELSKRVRGSEAVGAFTSAIEECWNRIKTVPMPNAAERGNDENPGIRVVRSRPAAHETSFCAAQGTLSGPDQLQPRFFKVLARQSIR